MVTIPENPVTADDLIAWDTAKNQLAHFKNLEMLLRMKIFKGLFPEPKEGTNTHPLQNGWLLKATHVITREIDNAALIAGTPFLLESKINVERLVERKPSLVKTQYNMLTEEERNLFDRVLTIKPGSPQMKIELPAKAKAAQEAAQKAQAALYERLDAPAEPQPIQPFDNTEGGYP